MGNAWKEHPNPARPCSRKYALIGDAFHLLPQAEQDAYDAAERGEAPASQSPPRASGVSSHGADLTHRLVRPASYP